MAAGRALFKFGANVKEFRVHLCQKSASSKGVREFIEKHYVELKKSNPKFPFLIRECSDVEPKLWARYGFGKESQVSLTDFTSDQVSEAIQKLAQKSS